MSDIRFGKITTPRQLSDGAIEYTTTSYYDGRVSNVKIEKEVSVKTSRNTFIGDILENVKPMTDKATSSITLTIKAKNGEPDTIWARWEESNENYGRR